MASRDWIKVEVGTPDKPEMAILARRLGVSLAEAFLNWFRVYAWADAVTATGHVPNLSHQDCDTLARAFPGTCAALASKEINWLTAVQGGIEFNNWDRHNGTSAKHRLYERERKRRQRAASQTCPADNGTSAGTIGGTKMGPIEKEKESICVSAAQKHKGARQFCKPTVEHVRLYADEKGLAVDAQAFVDHYVANGWKVGRTPMKDWQAAVRNWARRGRHDFGARNGNGKPLAVGPGQRYQGE